MHNFLVQSFGYKHYEYWNIVNNSGHPYSGMSHSNWDRCAEGLPGSSEERRAYHRRQGQLRWASLTKLRHEKGYDFSLEMH